MMKNKKSDFDSRAASWDDKPERIKLANDVASAIMEEVPLTPHMDALDFGCGTGLVTLRIHPLVHSVTGVDNSRGMLAVLEQKIREMNLANIETRLFDLEKGDILKGQYHLIFSSMTLHHVKETKAILEQFYNAALPSGYLCLADLDCEGGRFHSDNNGVRHFGFDRSELGKLLTEAGFAAVRQRTAARIAKTMAGGETVEFTVFLITGQRKA